MQLTDVITFVLNYLPIVSLALFLIFATTALIKKRWFYLYIALLVLVIHIQFLIFTNSISDAIGEGWTTYSELPYRKFWYFVTTSVYFYSFLGLIGIVVACIRKFLKLGTKSLFIVSTVLFLLGLATFVFIKELPCSYSPTKPCIVDSFNLDFDSSYLNLGEQI